MTEILARGIIALVIIVTGAALYLVAVRVSLATLRQRIRRCPTRIGLGNFRPGVAGILYFTSPDCAPCRTMQMPAIQTLLDRFGDNLDLVKIDAVARPDLADAWGVLTVPTTFVIDTRGEPRCVNHGVASAAKLRQQLGEIGVTPSPNSGRSHAVMVGAQPESCLEC